MKTLWKLLKTHAVDLLFWAGAACISGALVLQFGPAAGLAGAGGFFLLGSILQDREDGER